MWRYRLIQALANALTFPGRFPAEARIVRTNAAEDANKAGNAAAPDNSQDSSRSSVRRPTDRTQVATRARPKEQQVFITRLLGPVHVLPSSYEPVPDTEDEKIPAVH